MKYPLIYALSTVGILKHYNQDYLLHEQRTDFTGANGVGKSIIADLFQLIFVNDRQLFQFGTEGYKKDDRQIQKLPYKCRDGYVFLTIEIELDKFVCIGVCIPNSTNRPLKPFIITADPDSQRTMVNRSFGRTQLPTASQFINEQKQICSIDEIGRHFRDKYGLFFEHYSTSEQKDEHYARLYDQHLLPIDLSVPSSKKSFAKIIQSFSRARSGGSRSDELKDFLFDGVETELEQSFDIHKIEIERLLQDYKDLQAFILDLEAKQLQLEELHRLGEIRLNSQKAYLSGNCGFSLHASNKAQALYDAKIKEYEAIVLNLGKLAKELPKISHLSDGYQKLSFSCEQKLEVLAKCQEKADAIRELNRRIKQLTLEDLPEVKETFIGNFLIDDYDDQELLKRLRTFIPIYKKYGSIALIEIQTDSQKQIIQERKEYLNTQLSYHKVVNELFSNANENTLIAQVLNSNLSISPAQEAVLFYFLQTYWGKPESADYPYYAEGFKFFDNEHIQINSSIGGYWLRLGDLNIAIPALDHEPILGDPNLRSDAIKNLIERTEKLINEGQEELKQIQFFEKGQSFNPILAPFLTDMDAQLYDYAISADLALTAQLVLQLDGKTERLVQERDELQAQLNNQLSLSGISINTEINELIILEKNNLNCWKIRADYFFSRKTKDSAMEAAIRETSLPAVELQVEDKKAIVNRAMVNYLTDRTALETKYPELIMAELPEMNYESVEALKNQFNDATVSYQAYYRATCELFPETARGVNLEISTELREGEFSFPLLERVLLGKIRFRDQIAEELRNSNHTRYKLVKSIHETMLKVFVKTKTKFDEYRTQIRDLNLFFRDKVISNKYFFQVEFQPSSEIPIEWINQLQSQSQFSYQPDELPLGQPVEAFVEDFFKAATGYRKRIAFRDLLDPRTYFTLDAGLSNDDGKETSGSTGETYSAKVLLGIGRLSKLQSQNRPGIRFIILEETANLDKTNFNNFPAIADEFGYQIITMTPKPFGSDATDGWYLHHLLPGIQDTDINYPYPASYFKTNTGKEELAAYLKRKNA